MTRLGDPPLFLGYLQGVPFGWTFGLWKQWLVCNCLLLALYYAWDRRAFRAEQLPPPDPARPLALAGGTNFLYLGGVVGCIAFLPGLLRALEPVVAVPLFPTRELLLVGLVALSVKTTSPDLRRENRFTYHPVVEVAALFLGIFLSMIPALILLEARGSELGLVHPMQFFWATGALSAFLDNAPTYLVFFKLAQGLGLEGEVVAATGITPIILKAISLGAVFMGACTYIGNGPNFMVRSIAAEAGVRMPGFGGFMVWSAGILIPIFLLVTYLSLVAGVL